MVLGLKSSISGFHTYLLAINTSSLVSQDAVFIVNLSHIEDYLLLISSVNVTTWMDSFVQAG